MKILMTNFALQHWGGSELVTLEVALGLQSRGHQVSVFTFYKGAVSQVLANNGINTFGPEELASQNPSLEFDVIHCHHWPLAQHLLAFGVTAPVVFGFLGVIPDLENPPQLEANGEHFWWCVSKEVQANVLKTPGWSNVSSEALLIPNWAMPNSSSVARIAEPGPLKKLLVVSNHFPEEVWELVNESCVLLGISVEKIGLPSNHRQLSPIDLVDFDAVVTIGRTAITAMAIGKPTLIFDVHGCDGWLTPENYDSVSFSNFSGRHLRWHPTQDEVTSLLLAPPSVEELRVLQEKSRKFHNLSNALDSFEVLYRKAVEKGNIFKGFGRVAATLTDGYRRLLFGIYGERDVLLGERDVLLGERDVLLGERDVLLGERDALLSSATWRYTAFLRKIVKTFRT